ncbi:helix-turn-helix domain-containing protein [Mesobacillus foraminis]|uniref:helix-turn-helix domain-containing protein n=1 Tax=Mesobacillus foraminis TaxID=279826 RepID=UPI000EF53B42|nr:helix-turn-helix domain-containing protein [Mesobacillus foraminis]
MEEKLLMEVDEYLNSGGIFPYDRFKKMVPNHRSLVLNHILENLSVSVTAERWGVTENTVRVWKHRLKIKDIEKVDLNIKEMKDQLKLSLKFTHCDSDVLTHLLNSVLEEIKEDKSYNVEILIIER